MYDTDQLRLLLIEDTPSDARIFCEQVKERHGDQATVEWKRSFKEAMLYLKAHPEIDQIWLDPGLADLGKEALGEAIAYLKRYGEVQILSSIAAPAIKREAKKQEVEVYEKTADFGSVLEKIDRVLEARGGTTIKVGQAQLQGQIAKLDYQVGENVKAIEKSRQDWEQTVKALRDELAVVKKTQEAASNDTAVRLARIQAFSQVAVAIATGLFGLTAVIAPILIPLAKDFYFQGGNAPAQQPEQPKRSP